MDINITIKRLSYSIIWLMCLLEAITVPLVTLTGHYQPLMGEMKAPWHGLIIGALGTFCLFWLINRLLPKLAIVINTEKIVAFNSLGSISIWGGAILAFLFLWQKILAGLLTGLPQWIYLLVVGFIASFLTILLVIVLYKYLTRYINSLKITVLSTQKQYLLISIQPFYTAILVGIYESIALPLIWLSYAHFGYALLSGIIGGFAGSLVVVIIFNLWVKNKISLSFTVK